MELFEKALLFAADAHKGMIRKRAGTPYITHPMEVCVIASSISVNEELLCAALLHDTVEDTPVTAEDILREFGERVAYLVSTETEDKRPDMPPWDSWEIRKKESLQVLANCNDRDVKILWLSDKLSNMRSFYRLHEEEGEKLWLNFHQPDPKKQGDYYREIARLTEELSDTAAWKEYRYLLDEVFKGESE